ncbi:MAG: beta-1,6-N-acetylglucosaminyltransferase [Tabrizicola sp.]|nr:beta-1,6-N-acetylglucosaminyltransferase [Tabrizicola sp.]
MMKIAYILLCHKDPEGIIAQAGRLTAAGDFVAIHFDGNAPQAMFETIRSALAGNANVVFARRRVRCGWGEWSLVEATLQAVKAAEAAFPAATHFYMLSGDCMPIKTAEYIHDFLERDDADFIESVDFYSSGWIKAGITDERLIYRHWFNERRQKRLFYGSMAVQRKLGLVRKVPAGLRMQIGSQWWCLRRQTIERILEFLVERPDVTGFFRTTWIPDETFFQTLVRHLVPETEIRSRPLTFLLFTDYGMPATFYDDHFDFLIGQDYLFARKISPHAKGLIGRLGDLYAETGRSFETTGEGPRLFRFLTGRGRIGRRFAPRFWEVESSVGRDRTLMMVTCKKWHVAKRLVERVRAVTNLPAMDYLFDEAETPLPDLGGIQTTVEKRARHRRALVRMLFDYCQTDRLIFCIDPSNTEMMQDFYNDRCKVRVLEIECDFTDDYLIGHARRIGLAGERSPPEALERLLPTIRHEIRFESDSLRDMDFARFSRIRQSASADENSLPLAEFLDIPVDKAREIAATEYLFVD